jgi:GDP-D-mannose dehydratase
MYYKSFKIIISKYHNIEISSISKLFNLHNHNVYYNLNLCNHIYNHISHDALKGFCTRKIRTDKIEIFCILLDHP